MTIYKHTELQQKRQSLKCKVILQLNSLLALAIGCASVHFGLKFVYKTLRKTIIAMGEQLSTCADQLEQYKRYDITPSVEDVKKAMFDSFIEGIHERSTKR